MGRVESILHKVVHNRANYYASLWDVKTALSAGIAALDMLDSAGREKAIEIAKGLTEEKPKEKDYICPVPTCPVLPKALDAVKDALEQNKDLTDKEKTALDNLRQLLEPGGKQKKKKRRAKGG